MKRWLLALALFACLPGVAPAKFSSTSVQIKEDSEEGKNVKAAADLIRHLGSPKKADNILEMLKAGRLYWDPTLKENGDTDNLGWSKDLTIAGYLIHNTMVQKRGKPFDPEDPNDYDSLVNLSRTLCHEKVHVHQWRTGHVWASLLTTCMSHEYDAWTDTINNIGKWVLTAQEDYQAIPESDKAGRIKALKRLIDLIKLEAGTIDGLVENGHFAWFESDPAGTWKKIAERWRKQLSAYEKELEELKSENNRVGMLPQDLKSLLPSPLPGLRLPQEGELAINLVGNGRAAGDIFTVSLANNSDYKEEVCFMEGDVLDPSDPAYQRMMIGRSQDVVIPPHDQVVVHLDGFCLDPTLRPPDPTCHYNPTESEPYRGLQEILKVGNRLAREGGYAKDIQSAEKYRTTVIERAIWYEQSCHGPNPFDKDKLQTDLVQQVARLPEDKRPSSEETEKTANRIWDDVDLTVKTAASARHDPAR